MNKFILTENIKHILEEKYLLDERYILTEASEKYLTVLKNWFTKVINDLEPVVTKVEQIKQANGVSKNATTLEADLKAIEAAGNEINISRNNPDGQDEELKKDLVTWYQAILSLLKKLPSYNNNVNTDRTVKLGDPELKSINDDLTKLNKALTTGPFNKAEALSICDKLFDIIKEKVGGAISTDAKSSSDKVGKLKEACDNLLNRIEQLKNSATFDYTDLTDAEVSTCVNQLGIISKDITEGGEGETPVLSLGTKINFNNFEQNFNVYVNSLKLLADSIQAFLNLEPVKRATAAADAKKAKEGQADETAAERKNSEAKDWETLYQNCRTKEDFDAFWKDYFTTEWNLKGQDPKKPYVERFGINFIEDLKQYGFNAITNPFIKFLKTKTIFDLIGKTFNQDAYNLIHDAVAQGYLEGKDLGAGESSRFGKANVIFNPNLYKNLVTANKYIKAQDGLARNNTSLKVEIQKIYSDGQEGRIKVLNNLMLAAGDGDTFEKNLSAGGDLRPISEVEKIYNQITNSKLDDKSEATNLNLEEIINNIPEGKLKSVIAYLVDICRFSNNTKAVNDADNEAEGAIYRVWEKSDRPTRGEAQQFDSWLQLDRLTFTKPQLKALLFNLAVKAGLATAKAK